MASRALRICERQVRLRSSCHRHLLVSSSQSNPAGSRIRGLLYYPRNASCNVGPLFVITRYVSSTGEQLQHAPEHDEGEKKKPILGLNFLSKFFGRSQEPAAVAAEAAVETEPVENDVEAASGETYVESEMDVAEGQVLEEAIEEGQAMEMTEGAAMEGETLSEEGQIAEMTEGGAMKAEDASEEGQLTEAEASAETSEVVEAGVAESKVSEAEHIADVVATSEPLAQVPELKIDTSKEDIVKSVGEFIRSLPLEAVAPASVQETAKAMGKKPKATAKAVEEEPKAAHDKSKPVEVKPKLMQEKPKAVQEKTKPVAATTSAADTKSVTTKKSAADKSQKPVDAQADTGSVPEPVFDFLRSKINNANSGATGKTIAATSSSKPSPLKLSSRFEALSSSGSTVDKTTAAINKLLDTVDKSTKSPAAPIFDALDALNNKEEPAPSSPSLKLSLSSPPAEPAPMDAQTLMGEMNTRLTDGKINESITLFEEWRSSIDPRTLECNKPDRALYNLYMQAKLKIGADYEELLEVITEMEESGIPRDLAGYNTLIRALFRRKDSATAEKLLETMEKDEPQAQPDSDSYNLVVVLCALDRKVTAATKYMKTMIERGFEPSRTTINEVLLSASRAHQTQLAASLLKEIKAINKLPMPALNTCAELLMAASEVDDGECARLALAEISERPMAKFGPRMILDEGTMICALGTAARTGDKALCKNAWEALKNHTRGIGKSPSPEAFHTWIHALALSGDIQAAFTAVWEFELTHGQKSETDLEAFSPFTSLKSLASACSRGGPTALDSAYYILEEAHTKKLGVALGALNCIILGCANLWDSERAFQTFEAIENVFGLRPDIHSCNALMHALGRTKLTEDALKVYDYIKEAGFKPDRWTYMLLSDAHVVNHDAKAALDVLKKMYSEGHRPFRQTTLKVWTRSKQLEDNETLEGLAELEKELNYRPCFFANARRKLLLDVIKS